MVLGMRPLLWAYCSQYWTVDESLLFPETSPWRVSGIPVVVETNIAAQTGLPGSPSNESATGLRPTLAARLKVVCHELLPTPWLSVQVGPLRCTNTAA